VVRYIMNGDLLIIGFIVLFAFTTQIISGFGSIIIGLTLGSFIYPIEELLPILVLLTISSNIYILVKHRSYVDWTLLLKRIIPSMGVGLIIGIFIFNFFETAMLKKLYGIFVLFFSIRELFLLIGKRNTEKTIGHYQSYGWFFAAGIIHGIYASGGPLVVYPVSRIIQNKSTFRSTLVALWLCFNVVLVLSYAYTNRFTPSVITRFFLLFPLMILSIVLGEWLHNYVNEYKFRIIIFILLLFAGLLITVQ